MKSRIRGLLRSSLLALAFLMVASCAGESSQTDIPPQDPDSVAAGAELYEANCAECHGSDLRGTDKGPSHLSEVYEPSHHGDGAFQVAILAGSPEHHWDFGPMPPVEGLDQTDIDLITAFVRDRQRAEGFEPYPPG